MIRRITLFFGITFFCNTFFIQNVNAISLDLKIPFLSGESWRITQGFEGDGWGAGSPTHNINNKDRFAIDFSLPGEDDYNKSVLAAGKGLAYVKKQIRNGRLEGYGNYVDIDHGDGVISRYAHLLSISIEDGTEVEQGQEIGRVDNTGYNGGSHLHFAMYQKDTSGNLTPYKPEPMSGYTNFRAGEWYTSDNELYDPNKKVEEPTEQPQPKSWWDKVKDVFSFGDDSVSSESSQELKNILENTETKTEYENKTAETKKTYSLAFNNSNQTVGIKPGEEVNVSVQVKNTGTATWEKKNISANVVGGLAVNAEYHHQTWLTSLRPTLLDQTQLAPGEIGSFSFKINTPNKSGQYIFKIQVVRTDNNFSPVTGGYWVLNLNVKEREEVEEKIEDREMKQENKIKDLVDKIAEEVDDTKEVIKKAIQKFFFTGGNSEQADEEEETIITESIILPEIEMIYPTSTTIYTTSTSINFNGIYNTSTFNILVNNNSVDGLIMSDGNWNFISELNVGTTTFSFVGWNEDFTFSSEPINIEVIRQEIFEPTISLAPVILQPTTSSVFYTSSTSLLISGEKQENVVSIYLSQSGIISTSTVLTTTTWEKEVSLQEGENNLIFYGIDEFGDSSSTTSLNIILDTQAPEVEWLNIDLSSNSAQLDYNATDTVSGIDHFDIQFLFQYYSWPPSDFDPTIEEGETILSMNESILWNDEDEFLDYLDIEEHERIWWSATSTISTSTFLQLADFMYDMPVHFRVRSLDNMGNVSAWQYSGLKFFDSIYPETGNVVISEIAWMGTEASSDDEWIEIMNIDEESIYIGNWKLAWNFNTSTGEYDTVIDLDDLVLDQEDSWLLERTNQETVSTFDVSQIYTGALSNQGEYLVLLDANGDIMDEVNNSNGWWFGNNETKESMYRSSWENSGNEISSWTNFTSSTSYINISYKEEKDSAGNYILGSPGNAPTSMM